VEPDPPEDEEAGEDAAGEGEGDDDVVPGPVVAGEDADAGDRLAAALGSTGGTVPAWAATASAAALV
jgi:hypothetical protein